MIHKKMLSLAIDKLAIEFADLDLSFHDMGGIHAGNVTSYWPGRDDEDVMICVFKGKKIHEPFHRQDFFFINYAYQNSYAALSAKDNRLITIGEGECYIGQPYSGYALRGAAADKEEIIIIGILIQRDAFFRNYLPIIYADASLFRFFLEPKSNRFSDEYIHLSMQTYPAVRLLLELMVMEYADRKEDTQHFLKSLLQPFMIEVTRRFAIDKSDIRPKSISEQIMDYMDNHSDVVTLKDISRHFSYHPNYISTVLRKETGRKFTEILLEKRMGRASLLLKSTALPIEEISAMLGYSNHSNFYKAFKEYYGITPREYQHLKAT